MRKGRVRLMDRPFQKVCLQIGGKQMQELETQLGISKSFPLLDKGAEIRKNFGQIEPTVRSKPLCNRLGKANGIRLTASTYETHFSIGEDFAKP